jgi:LysM repeat protein
MTKALSMKTLRIFLIFLLLLAIGAAVSAQASPVTVSVSISCSSISVTVNSTYDRAIKAQVYAGTGQLGSWDLVDDIGNYTRANANSSGSRSYSFPQQRANTLIFYAVYVYDDVTSNQIATVEGNRDCDGTANNAPTATPTPSTTATPTPSSGGTTGCNNIPANARAVHVVQAGENLFRIGLRYGVHYTTLATYNGIADPARIYVGQCIAIPPAS